MKNFAFTALLALTLLMINLSSSKVHAKTPSDRPETQTVQYVDLLRYAGAWYDIASKPTSYEHDCVCSRQVVTPARFNTRTRSIDKLKIQMSCNRYSPQGSLQQINLDATNTDPRTNAKLRATYNFFIKLDYWVIGLANDYSWAVLTNPSGSMLYIVSKTPQLSPEKYAEAVKVAAEQRDVSELRPVSQEGCTYP